MSLKKKLWEFALKKEISAPTRAWTSWDKALILCHWMSRMKNSFLCKNQYYIWTSKVHFQGSQHAYTNSHVNESNQGLGKKTIVSTFSFITYNSFALSQQNAVWTLQWHSLQDSQLWSYEAIFHSDCFKSSFTYKHQFSSSTSNYVTT